jgi:kumamolisin
MSHYDFAGLCGADPADITGLRDFAAMHGLQEVGCAPHRRVMHLRAVVADLEQAFNVQLGDYQPVEDGLMLADIGSQPTLPQGAIAVLGLDRRPVAYPHVRLPHAQPSQTYTPIQLGGVYGFPTGADGAGQTVAILDSAAATATPTYRPTSPHWAWRHRHQ